MLRECPATKQFRMLMRVLSQTWRAVLWILAGLTLAVAILAFFFVPADNLKTVDKRIDWIGAGFVTVGLILLQFVVSEGPAAPQGWRTSCELFGHVSSEESCSWTFCAGLIVLLVISVCLITAFFFWEHHVINHTSRPPLIRLTLFTRAKGRLSAVYFIGFVSWMGFIVSCG